MSAISSSLTTAATIASSVSSLANTGMQVAQAAGAFAPEQQANPIGGPGAVQIVGQPQQASGPTAARQPMQQPNLQQPLQQPNPLGGLPGGGGWM